MSRSTSSDAESTRLNDGQMQEATLQRFMDDGDDVWHATTYSLAEHIAGLDLTTNYVDDDLKAPYLTLNILGAVNNYNANPGGLVEGDTAALDGLAIGYAPYQQQATYEDWPAYDVGPYHLEPDTQGPTADFPPQSDYYYSDVNTIMIDGQEYSAHVNPVCPVHGWQVAPAGGRWCTCVIFSQE